ncbi:MAG: prepilin peptidase [Anaerolineales bacterium]|nr:prepilin peptidase [Anaerolineales bacterium]
MYILIGMAILLGWCAGLIINYLSDVLPRTRRFSPPVCLNCDARLEWQRYLLLRKCPQCGARRNWRTWVTQLLITGLSVFVWVFPPGIGYFPGMLLLTYLGLIFVIDMEHRLILHPTSIAGLLLCLGLGIYLHSIDATIVEGIFTSLLGGLAGFGIMMVLYLFGILFTKLRARRMQASGITADDEEALGGGDVILLTILGLILGWQATIAVIFLGILASGIVSIVLIAIMLVKRRFAQDAFMTFIPLGPYFILSTFFILYILPRIPTT